MDTNSEDVAHDGDWDLVIKPKDKLLDFNLREIFHYRDLIGLLAKRDLANVYKQTLLGPLWFMIQPLLTTLIYMFVFGNIAKIGTDGIPQPLFYFSGTMLWTFFASNLTKSSETFAANAGLFGKIYFPRFTVPISYMITSLVTLAVQLVLLIAFYAYYAAMGVAVTPTWGLLLAPVLVVELGVLGIGIGIIISSFTTKYRDLKHLVGFGMQLWMYATPIIYPASKIPGKWRSLLALNPVSPIIEAFRTALLGHGSFDVRAILISMGMTTIIILGGIIIFNHNERTFIDVV
jgi:lipopolysaccharide transport system permease protein